jgi:hypothetical protein
MDNEFRVTPIFQEHAHTWLYTLWKVVDEKGVLSVYIEGMDNAKFQVKFDTYIAYRKYDEGDGLLTLHFFRQHSALGRSFYRLYNSEFINWLKSESFETWSNERIAHYSIHTVDDIIDIISIDPPNLLKII